MPKIYIVSSGEYSDYRINKVFSTEVLAKEWVGKFTDRYAIEEHDLDDMEGKQVLNHYHAVFYFESKIMRIYPQRIGDYRGHPLLTQLIEVESTGAPWMGMCFPPDYDNERMTKVLADTRAKMVIQNDYQMPKAGIYRKSNFEYLGRYLYEALKNLGENK
jgi:hypothetical protein